MILQVKKAETVSAPPQMTTLDEIAGIPTVCDVALALYSKLLPDRVQGAGQVTRGFHLKFPGI